MCAGDSRTASDNLAFLLGFFERFPRLAGNKLWVAGESYAGGFIVNQMPMGSRSKPASSSEAKQQHQAASSPSSGSKQLKQQRHYSSSTNKRQRHCITTTKQQGKCLEAAKSSSNTTKHLQQAAAALKFPHPPTATLLALPALCMQRSLCPAAGAPDSLVQQLCV